MLIHWRNHLCYKATLSLAKHVIPHVKIEIIQFSLTVPKMLCAVQKNSVNFCKTVTSFNPLFCRKTSARPIKVLRSPSKQSSVSCHQHPPRTCLNEFLQSTIELCSVESEKTSYTLCTQPSLARGLLSTPNLTSFPRSFVVTLKLDHISDEHEES